MNQIEQNSLLLNAESLQKVLSYIPINQRLKLRELNSEFDQCVCQTPLPLNLNQYKGEQFKQEEVNEFLKKFAKPSEIVFPQMNAKDLKELVILQDNSSLTKFDVYELEDVPLEYVEKSINNASKLISFGFKNQNHDLSGIAKHLSHIQELKIGQWNEDIKQIVLQQADSLQSIMIDKGSNQIMLELIALYYSIKKTGVDDIQELNIKEIKFNTFHCSSDQQESLNVLQQLLDSYNLKVLHFGTLTGDQEKSIIFLNNFFSYIKNIQDLQIGFTDSNLLTKLTLKPIHTLRLSGVIFKKDNFMWLMKQAKLFRVIDLRQCKFEFAYADTFEKIENSENIVDIYVSLVLQQVNTGLDDQQSCQLAQFQYNNIWINFIYPFKYDLDDDYELQKQLKK